MCVRITHVHRNLIATETSLRIAISAEKKSHRSGVDNIYPPVRSVLMITPQTKDAEEMEHVVTNCLLELLLGSKLVGVAALALAAVGGTGRETGLFFVLV